MTKSYENIKKDKNFLEKYQYIDIERLKWVNKSTIFLHILSCYNISAPIINLLTPFTILFIPFLILKIMKLPITFETYKEILIEQIKNSSIGKLLYQYNDISFYKKIYLLMCVGLYIYNIYQNMVSCYRFYNNTHFILQQFDIFNTYLDYTIEKIKYFENIIQKYKSYDNFRNDIIKYKNKLIRIHNLVRNIKADCTLGTKCKNIGHVMKQFYDLYDSKETNTVLSYSFGFHGYIDTILGIYENYKDKKINKITFTKNKTTTFKLKKSYHPSIKENIVKNNINMKENHIITGPNAAGKTTLLKSSIINLILSQQIGMGFYSSGKITPFDYIHCYINIPDSCSRDSLFQAEARRCKNILDCISEQPDKKHFCIFDELYSGTNPYEAVSSAYSYLNFISNNKNVRFMITTHYVKLCELIENKKINNTNISKTNNIINKNMNAKIINDMPKYSYKLVNGISNIKGGVSVLKQFDYPNPILKLTKTILNNI